MTLISSGKTTIQAGKTATFSLDAPPAGKQCVLTRVIASGSLALRIAILTPSGTVVALTSCESPTVDLRDLDGLACRGEGKLSVQVTNLDNVLEGDVHVTFFSHLEDAPADAPDLKLVK